MQMQKVKVIAGERTAPGNVKCKREIALSRNSSDFVDLIQRSDWIFKEFIHSKSLGLYSEGGKKPLNVCHIMFQ